MSFSVFGPCELAAAAGDMCHGFCMLLAQPASWPLHSVVVVVVAAAAAAAAAVMVLVLVLVVVTLLEVVVVMNW